MKRILFILSMLIGVAYGQTTGYFRYDTVTFQKIGGTSEFNLRNATRAVTGGVLTNMGNGRTAFVTPSGSTNTSIGSGYKVAVDGTNNVKSLGAGVNIVLDSATSGQVGITAKNIATDNLTQTTVTRNHTISDGTNRTLNFLGNNSAISNAIVLTNLNFRVGQAGSTVQFQASQGTTIVSAPAASNYAYTQMTGGYMYHRAKDSIELAVGDPTIPSSATSYVKIFPFSQDSYAPDSVTWRLTDRSALLTFNATGWHAWQNNGEYYFYNVARETDSTGLDILAWDRADQELKRIPSDLLGGGATPTLPQVLTAGSTLTSAATSTININTGNLIFQNGNFVVNSTNTGNVAISVNASDETFLASPDATKQFSVRDGGFYYDGMSGSHNADDSMLVINPTTKIAGYRPIPSGGGLTVGTTTITSGTNTRVLFNNSGVLGEYTVSGSGNVALTTSPVFTTPNIGVASGTSVTLSSLTSGRVPIVSTSGLITDDAGLLFDPTSNTLRITGTSASVTNGPKIAFDYTGDANSVMSYFAYTHDNIAGPVWDAYYNGSSWVSSFTSSNFALYKNTDQLAVGYNSGTTTGSTFGGFNLTDGVRFTNNGRLGIGVAAAAKLHVLSTTEQLRVGYDGSNYYSTTVGSTGGVTFNAVGSGSAFTYSDAVTINGDLTLGTAGNKIFITTGSNASIGTSAAMTAGTITISTTAVSANSKVFLSVATPGGTQGFLSVGTIVAGTSFVINSSGATDTSTVNWWIIN